MLYLKRSFFTLIAIISINYSGALSARGEANFAARRDPALSISPLYTKAAFFQAAIDLVERARESVRLEVYTFSGDDGMRLARALVLKASQGVVTQVLLDPTSQRRGLLAQETFNPGGVNNPVPDYLREQAAIVNRGRDPRLPLLEVLDFDADAEANWPIDDAGLPGQGMPLHHAKGLFVDDRWLIVGGNNFDRDPTHDLSMLIEDPGLAGCVVERFNLQWSIARGRVLASTRRCAPGLDIKLYTAGGGFQEIKPVVLEKLRDPGTTSLDLQMYALGDLQILDGMIGLHNRGGEIRVIVNKGEDDPDPSNFYMARALRNAGIPVRRYKDIPGGYLHSKLAIFNRSEIFTGSTNWIRSEFNYVWNYMFAIKEPAFSRDIVRFFENDWQHNTLPYFGG